MENTSKSMLANLYNPHEQNKAQLIERFIVRQRVFREIVQDITSAPPTQPARPYLLEGQRGMGKTTLLLRVSYEIENDPETSAWLLPIVLKEEAHYGIRQLFRLWEVLAQELEAKDRSFSGLAQQMQAARQNLTSSAGFPDQYERTCFELVVRALSQRSQHILLCIDNLGEMLQNFSDRENLRFREILAKFPQIRLLGATSMVFESIAGGKLAQLFHHTFTIIRLEGLNKTETYELFLALAKTSQKKTQFANILAQYPGRFEALRILTGGVIRTLVLLFEIFVSSQNDDALSDLEEVLDRITPLYQNRMNDLTPLQRDVVNAIALNWDAITLEDIARATCLSHADALIILTELETLLIVDTLIMQDQRRFYQLRERFFNIWYLMRLAPGNSRSQVLWLLHFLESWYERGELVRQARIHTDAMAAKRATPHSAYYLTEALVRTGQLDMETEHRMLQATRDVLRESGDDLIAELSPSDKDAYNAAEICSLNGDYPNAVAHLVRIKQKTDQVYCRLGEVLRKLGHDDQALNAFRPAIEAGNVDAMRHTADIYRDTLKDYQTAKTYYVTAVKHGNFEAMFALGNLYAHHLKAYTHAEQTYIITIREGQKRVAELTSAPFSFKTLQQYLHLRLKESPRSSAPHQSEAMDRLKGKYLETIRRMSGEAMLQLGDLYASKLNKPDQAIHYYQSAIKTGCAEAVLQLALLYQYTVHDYKQAIKYYRLALQRHHDLDAAVNLGILYQQTLKDYASAEKYYLLAVKNGHAAAMNGLAWLYFEEKQHKTEALRYAKQAADKEQTIYTAHTLACIYLWNDRPDEAVRVAREFMYNQDAYTYLNQDILLYLMLLLARKQADAVAHYFEDADLNLRERFKPLYYAFLYHTKHPDYQKRPSELIEPIGGIIGRIQRLTASYA